MKQACWYCGHENSETEKVCCLCHRPVTKDTSGKHVPAETVQKKPVAGIASPYINGKTKVRVMRRDVHEKTGKEVIREVKTGIIVQQGTLFVRVYDNQPVADGGDTSQAIAEKFPISSRNCWLEIIGELKYTLNLAPEVAS